MSKLDCLDNPENNMTQEEFDSLFNLLNKAVINGSVICKVGNDFLEIHKIDNGKVMIVDEI